MIVEVVYALPDRQQVMALELGESACVADALEAAASQGLFNPEDVEDLTVGIFGDVVERARALRPGDRVELYRPLQMDPKQARKRRADTTNRQ